MLLNEPLLDHGVEVPVVDGALDKVAFVDVRMGRGPAIIDMVEDVERVAL